MNSTLTVRKPMEIDVARMSLRRGFLDVHTPQQHLRELQLPIVEQRALVKRWISELETERKEIHAKLGKTGKAKNCSLAWKINKKPGLRRTVRSGRTERERLTDRFLDCGREIQMLQKLLGELPKPPQARTGAAHD